MRGCIVIDCTAPVLIMGIKGKSWDFEYKAFFKNLLNEKYQREEIKPVTVTVSHLATGTS